MNYTQAERLIKIETIVDRLDKELLGTDGNGGFVKSTNDRLATLDKERAWIKGAYAILSTIVGALGLSGLVHIFRGLDQTK